MQNNELTDDGLVEGYLNGDISCFIQLLNRYQARLFNYIYRRTEDKQEAEDIFQEIFYRVIDNLRHYRKEGHFKAWLFKIAFNICVDNARKKKKMILVSMNQEFATGEAEGASLEGLITADSPSPSDSANDKEIQKLLQEALGCLSREQKEVLLLHIYGRLSFKEISQVLRCSINTVLARMQYALKHLRNILDEKGVIDEL